MFRLPILIACACLGILLQNGSSAKSLAQADSVAAKTGAVLNSESSPIRSKSSAKKRKLPARRGGKVRRAWPANKKGRPKNTLARWLAQQVGPSKDRSLKTKKRRTAKARRSARASATQPASTPDVESAELEPLGTASRLRLVRSFQVPPNDPAYERLLSLSFTYDSAIGAAAFIAADERSQAEQLLDQLVALQRADGSFEYAYNVLTGESLPTFRSGTVAWVGLAATFYRSKYGSQRYDDLATRAARWLIAHQINNPNNPAYGAVYGGPGVDWTSTQHNLVAYFFLKQFASQVTSKRTRILPFLECIKEQPDGSFQAVFGYQNRNPFPVEIPVGAKNRTDSVNANQFLPEVFNASGQEGVFALPFQGKPKDKLVTFQSGQLSWTIDGITVTADTGKRRCEGNVTATPTPTGSSGPISYNRSAELIAGAIERTMLIQPDPSTSYFNQGINDKGVSDTIKPLDAQTLGTIFLLSRGKNPAAEQVYQYMNTHFFVDNRSVNKSSGLASFNLTYDAKGPFLGFRPYSKDDPNSPDVLWTEGTAQAYLVLEKLGQSTAQLSGSLGQLSKLTSKDGDGLLGADRTVTNNPLNEYHVWPTSAATSWTVLARTNPAKLFGF